MLYEQFKKEYLPVALELEKITKTYPKSKQPQYANHAATFEATNLKKKIIELVWATMSTKPFQMKREDIDFFDVPLEIDDENDLQPDSSSPGKYAIYEIACELKARTEIFNENIAKNISTFSE